MAISRYTANLKLAITSDLSDIAISNLEKIDSIGSSLTISGAGELNITNAADITIEPDAPSRGGFGTAGTVNLGSDSHTISLVDIFSTSVQFHGTADLLDSASSYYLKLQHNSSLAGSPNTAPHVLSFDLEDMDRSVILGGNLTLAASLTTTGGGQITLNSVSGGTVSVPATGTLMTITGVEQPTNKIINADLNTITNIADDEIKAGAAISGTKISPDFGTQDIETSGNLRLEDAGNPGTYIIVQTPTLSTGYNLVLPDTSGTLNQVLKTDGAGNLSWTTVATDSLPEDNVRIGNPSGNSVAVDTTAVGDIEADSTLGLTIKADKITNSMVNSSAAIAYSKLNLAASLVDSDINASAAIAYSKLNLATSIVDGDVNGSAAIAWGKISKAGSSLADLTTKSHTALSDIGTNSHAQIDTHIAGATAHGVAGVLVGTTDTQTLTNKTISGSANTLTNLSLSVGIRKAAADWITADGTSKVVTHSFGTSDVMVEVYDSVTGETEFPDTVVRTDVNTVTLTRSIAPTNTLRVLIKEIG